MSFMSSEAICDSEDLSVPVFDVAVGRGTDADGTSTGSLCSTNMREAICDHVL